MDNAHHSPPDCRNHGLNVWCGLHGDPDDAVPCPPSHYGSEARADYDRLVADNAALRAEVRALTEERDHLAGLVEQLEYEGRPLIEDIDVEGGVL